MTTMEWMHKANVYPMNRIKNLCVTCIDYAARNRSKSNVRPLPASSDGGDFMKMAYDRSKAPGRRNRTCGSAPL